MEPFEFVESLRQRVIESDFGHCKEELKEVELKLLSKLKLYFEKPFML